MNAFGIAVELFDQWSLSLSSEVVVVSSDPMYQSLEFRQGVAASTPRLAAKAIRAMLSVNISWAEKEALLSFMIVIID